MLESGECVTTWWRSNQMRGQINANGRQECCYKMCSLSLRKANENVSDTIRCIIHCMMKRDRWKGNGQC